MRLSPAVKNLRPSPTLAVNAKAQALKAQGRSILDLSVGEPDFPTPSEISDAAKQALDSGWTRYSPVAGYPDLREAISQYLRRKYDYNYSPSEIAVTTGAKQALFNAVLSLIGPGDEVIIPSPYWVSYPDQVSLAGGTPVFLPTKLEDGFQINPAKLAELITPYTKMLILNSPSNPTGVVYRREILRKIAEILKKHPQIILLSDEIYNQLVYGSAEALSILNIEPSFKERTVLINGFSKAYAMTGWRVGYIAAPEPVIRAVSAVQGASTSGTNSFVQRAALAALSPSLDPKIQEMKSQFERRRDLIVELFSSIPGVKVFKPDGAFYLFADFSAYLGSTTPDGNVVKNTIDLSEFILIEGGVAAVPGEAFGAPGFIRFSYAADTQVIEKAAEKVKHALSLLKK